MHLVFWTVQVVLLSLRKSLTSCLVMMLIFVKILFQLSIMLILFSVKSELLLKRRKWTGLILLLLLPLSSSLISSLTTSTSFKTLLPPLSLLVKLFFIFLFSCSLNSPLVVSLLCMWVIVMLSHLLVSVLFISPLLLSIHSFIVWSGIFIVLWTVQKCVLVRNFNDLSPRDWVCFRRLCLSRIEWLLLIV